MTKEQERQTLAKIDKIIKEAGPDSYIGTTFAGIVEQAEENITNDWGICPVKDLETANEKIDSLKRSMDAVKIQADAAIKSLEDENKSISDKLEQVHGWYEQQKKRNTELLKEIEDASGDIDKYLDKQHADKNEIEALQAEIITLKAKLYDLMTQ